MKHSNQQGIFALIGLLTAALPLAVTGQPVNTTATIASENQSTTATQKRMRGMIDPDEEPISEGTKGRKLTPLEKRAEKKKEMDANPIHPDPNVRNMPPQMPRDGTSMTIEPHAGAPLNGTTYAEQGPGPSSGGQAENTTPSNQVVGACNSVACHPGNADVLYVGMVNGGIWKTTNATNASPTWSPQTDTLGSLSIGSVEFDPTDATSNTLVAGIGRASSLANEGGGRIGVIRTTDGGTNWAVVGSANMAGKNLVGVAPRGSTIVAAANASDANTYATIGIFRSTNSGSTFSQVSNTNTSLNANGLPGGRAQDLQGDPTNNAILYTGFVQAGTNNGIYKSTDTGATWSRVSDATMNALITDASTGKLEIAVGKSNNVFVAIVNNGKLAAVFRSGNGGSSWTQMGIPGTTESSTFHGIHVGGQGATHLSIAAAPTDANIVYIGGDRQPGSGDTGASFPNSIGASNYSGRLFRGDASQVPASQWKPLTHSNSVAAFPGGGTASNSSPHGDSRDMSVDANGRLIEGDDGGVWVRTNPLNNSGNWFSLASNLKATESHDVAYDTISNKIIVGNQDNGSARQLTTSSWSTVIGGDGGDVAVDDVSLLASNRSIRYMSFQYLGSLGRWTYNSSNNLVTNATCALTLLSGSPAISAQFVTPVKINKVAPARLAIGAQNGVYESLNQGGSVTRVTTAWAGDGLNGGGLAYGGKQGGVDNPNVMYVVDGATAYVRTSTTFSNVAVPTGGEVMTDVVMDTNNYANAYAVSPTKVFQTNNTGGSWSEITGSGATGLVNVGELRCIEFVPNASGGSIVVGCQTGVYVAKASAPTVWYRLGNNLPAAAFIYDMDYDATDDVLVAASLGRSVWMMSNASNAAAVPVSLSTWQVF